MTQENRSQQERREFFRLNFNTPLKFQSYQVEDPAAASGTARVVKSRNISQAGILFQTENRPPQLSSVLWMNLDIRTLQICQEIEKKALVQNGGLLGRVVRVEESPENQSVYDIGVAFITQDQKHSRDIQSIISQIS